MERKDLPSRVAVNVRAEMAAQRKTAVQLANLLDVGHQAALRRVNGEVPFSLAELAQVASWLEVRIADLLATRGASVAGAVAS